MLVCKETCFSPTAPTQHNGAGCRVLDVGCWDAKHIPNHNSFFFGKSGGGVCDLLVVYVWSLACVLASCYFVRRLQKWKLCRARDTHDGHPVPSRSIVEFMLCMLCHVTKRRVQGTLPCCLANIKTSVGRLSLCRNKPSRLP